MSETPSTPRSPGSPRTPRVPIPGETALKNMQLLKKESSIFKVPKVPKPKALICQSKVLDEEEYVKGIAKLIERDFFPDLPKLKAQNEYLEAMENKDYIRLREITHKYSGNRPTTDPNPYASPATFDTPSMDRPFTPGESVHKPTASNSNTEQVQTSETNKADPTKLHSLDSYLASHTSEDNSSYDKLIALENRKKAAKVADQFEAERISTVLADNALMLPSMEEQADQIEKPFELDTWRFKARNYIMYVPEGAASQQPSAKPDLQHHNTRLKADPFDQKKSKEEIEAIAKIQGAAVRGKINVDGTCADRGNAAMGTGGLGSGGLGSGGLGSGGLGSGGLGSGCLGSGGLGTGGLGSAGLGGVGGWSYVATPSPRPGLEADASPLMTWGRIEGTPFRLDGGDTPLPAVGAGAAYRMLEGGAREKIGLRLAEQAARKRRPTTPRTPAASPNFRTNTERLASMSPAARRLATKHLKLTPTNVGVLSHSAATPKRTPTSARRPLVATPNNKKAATPRTNAVEENTLTDNLLQINVAKRTRLKAQDFF